MAINIKKEIEEAFISLLSGVSYLQDNSVPVFRFSDRSKALSEKQILIKVDYEPVAPGVPNYWLYVDIIACTYIPDDKNQSKLNLLKGEIFNFANSLTIPQINAVTTNILTEGKLMEKSENFDPPDNYQEDNVRLKIPCRITG